MEDQICDLIMGNIQCIVDLQTFQQKTQAVQTQSQTKKQPDLNLRKPSLRSAAVRPKLKLLPRTVKDPVNTVVHTEKNASIFGTDKRRESSLVNKTKQTLSESNKSQGQSTDWRKHRRLVINDTYCHADFQTHTR